MKRPKPRTKRRPACLSGRERHRSPFGAGGLWFPALDRWEDLTLRPGADSREVLAATEPKDDLLAFSHRTMLDAYASADRYADLARRPRAATYPDIVLGRQLELVAGLIKVGFGSRVYYAIQPGYDTHKGQLPRHGDLLSELSASVAAFQAI